MFCATKEKAKSKEIITKFDKSIDEKDNETRIKILLETFRKYSVGKGDDDRNQVIISKGFIKLLFEYSLRINFDFLNYDLFLLKYIS